MQYHEHRPQLLLLSKILREHFRPILQHKLTFSHKLANVLPYNPDLLKFLAVDLAGDFIRKTDVLGYFGVGFDVDGDDLDVLVLEVGLLEVRLGFVDLGVWKFGDIFLDMMEQVREVRLLEQVGHRLLSHPFLVPATPIHHPIGENLNTILISNFIKIVQQSRQHVHLRVKRLPLLCQGEHQPQEPGNCSRAGLREEDDAPLIVFEPVLSGESLEGLGDVEDVALVVGGDHDGGD